MNLILELIEPGRPPRRLPVSRSLSTIGRSSQCDIRIDSDSVSSRHARIKLYENHVVIEDLDSTNGVLVNGQRAGRQTIIRNGDEIQLGTGGPTLAVVAGAGDSSSVIRAASSDSAARSVRPRTGRSILIAIALFSMLLCLTAVAAAIWWIASKGRDRLEISSITDSRLSQAVGMVICGAEVVIDGEADEIALGSGTSFAVTSDGFLVTNRHVVEGFNGGVEEIAHQLFEAFKESVPEDKHDEVKASIKASIRRPRIWVALNGEILDAEVKMISDGYDLAVLKIPKKQLPFFCLSTTEVDRLTEVSAIGFPGAASSPISEYDAFEKYVRAKTGRGIGRFFTPSDLEFTQTQGKVSKIAHKASANGMGKTTWIQHTASISPGNSGGPLCLDSGAVAGVNTLISSEDGNMKFSFSTPQVREELEAVTGELTWK